MLKSGISESAIAAFAHELNPQAVSGRQEMLEGVVNRFIYT